MASIARDDSRDIGSLTLEMRDKVNSLLEACLSKGVEMRFFSAYRSIETQAKLWRQSRSKVEIERAIANLRNSAPMIAETIWSVGPQYGRWATNSLPGQSWHNWGEAVDCFVVSSMGQAVWSSQHAGYGLYAAEATALGLTAGHHWKSRDSVHVQLKPKSVRELYTWTAIEEEMKRQRILSV